MHQGYHALIGAAAKIPTNESLPIISYSPFVIPAPDRPVDLELRVTMPATGNSLPIIIFSHGHGRSNSLSSLEGYAPLCEFWAAHGFVVLQPTHLSSAFLKLQAPEGQEMNWPDRAKDITRILDNLEHIVQTVPGLQGRTDSSKIAIAGHSLGAWTTSLVLGASNTDPRSGSKWHQQEKRIKAGIILAGIGKGGADISEAGKDLVPFYNTDFSTMTTPTLVVYGDQDVSPHLTVRGADWHADPYTLSPGPKDLLMIKGAKHGLGGISGWDALETLDESPERLAVVQRMTCAYLKSQLFEGNGAWADACLALDGLSEQGKVVAKV